MCVYEVLLRNTVWIYRGLGCFMFAGVEQSAELYTGFHDNGL